MSNNKITVFWFRRDLRLNDNAALYYALKENTDVLPIFIFDTTILNKLSNKFDRRVDFIHQALNKLNSELYRFNSSLHTFCGTPLASLKRLIENYQVKSVYANHDYEPEAVERDKLIGEFLKENGIAFKTYKDQCVFEKDEVLKDDGTPYTVFTPYSRKWKQKLSPFFYKAYPNENYFHNFYKTKHIEIPTLEKIGFKRTNSNFFKTITVSNLLLQKYKEQRDYPALNATSRLSVHLRFGTVSVRALVAQGLPLSESWLNEIIWRDFYMMILFHFPHVVKSAFKKNYDSINWKNNEEEFKKWCAGKTGFPLVDAGMRELNETGFMHNRVRMVVSSFLVKDLLIDWRWGEAYFAEKLNDFDLSANNGGWQWAAGSGCDAAPYFRIFNPTEQHKKFDPDFNYIKKWVPEVDTLDYCKPITNHAIAKVLAINTYKAALRDESQTKLF